MAVRRRRFRHIAIVGAAAALATVSLTVGEVAASTPAHATGTLVSLAWQRNLPNSYTMGGAGVVTLDGDGSSLVFGDRAGKVWALHTADGSSVSGWPYQANAQIVSTPATIGSGSTAKVYVGVGTAVNPAAGGYLSLSNTGAKRFETSVSAKPNNGGSHVGVMASLALGPIQTSMDVVGGGMGQQQLAMNASTGATLHGFPWFQADTNFSSPALADLYGTGHDAIIEGGDSTQGLAFNYQYLKGGHIRILRGTGASGYSEPNGGLYCQYNTTQVVQSSPAVGNFLDSGYQTGIVEGTGTFWPGVSDTNELIAIDTSCHLKWKVKLDSNSISSPALADVDGDPTTGPDVVTESGSGRLYVINGSTGAVRWTINFGGIARGSVATFAAPNGHFQYIVVPTSNGVFLVNGLTRAYTKITSTSVETPVTVTADPDGQIGITLLGYGQYGGGSVEHYVVNGNYSVSTVLTPGAWPMFHRDPQLDGYAPDLPAVALKRTTLTGGGLATGGATKSSLPTR